MKPLWRGVMRIEGVRVKFEFEKTTKGNGGLRFPGGMIRNYDNHNDGIIFQPYGLEARFIDPTDLEFSGIGVRYGDTDDEKEIERRPVRAVFRFNPSTKKFTCLVSDPWIYTDME